MIKVSDSAETKTHSEADGVTIVMKRTTTALRTYNPNTPELDNLHNSAINKHQPDLSEFL